MTWYWLGEALYDQRSYDLGGPQFLNTINSVLDWLIVMQVLSQNSAM